MKAPAPLFASDSSSDSVKAASSQLRHCECELLEHAVVSWRKQSSSSAKDGVVASSCYVGTCVFCVQRAGLLQVLESSRPPDVMRHVFSSHTQVSPHDA